MAAQDNLGFEHEFGPVYGEDHGGFPFWVTGWRR
jgi:hypothetical protein